MMASNDSRLLVVDVVVGWREMMAKHSSEFGVEMVRLGWLAEPVISTILGSR